MKLILSWGYALAAIASLVAAIKTNQYSLLLGIPIAFSALFIVSLGPVAQRLLDTASKDTAIFSPIRASAWLLARLSRWFILIWLIAFVVLLNSNHFVGAWLVGTYILASNTIRWYQAAYLSPISSEKADNSGAPPPQEDPLASPSILIWLPWYFTRRALSVFTIPLFLFLLAELLWCLWAGSIYCIAMVRASGAVFGGIAAFVAASFAWFPAFSPAILYYSLLRNIPGMWLRRDVNMRAPAKFGIMLGMLVLFFAIAEAFVVGDRYAIAWIADRNPCASFKAGVTGSIPPPQSCR